MKKRILKNVKRKIRKSKVLKSTFKDIADISYEKIVAASEYGDISVEAIAGIIKILNS